MTLFWKIFLGFWLTVVLTAASSLWVVNLLRQDQDIALHGDLANQFNILQENLRQGGSTALLLHSGQQINYPEELVVATEENQLLWPKDASTDAVHLLSSLTPDNPTLKDVHQHVLSIGLLINTDDGEVLKVIARQPLPPLKKQGLLISIALLISIVICGLIARAIVMPLRRMSKTSSLLAEGDLEARVDLRPSIFGRDDLDRLAADFNYMAEKLKQSVSAHKQLLHDVSHELRSPLTRIRLTIELARTRNHNIDPSVEQSLMRIDRECEQIDELIAEILSLPQLDAQHLKLDERVDLVALIKDRIKAAQLEADAASNKVEFNLSDQYVSGPILIRGKAYLLARVIDNLLSNALRYSPGNGVIRIFLSHHDSGIIFSVQDEGAGVPEADLQRIFEAFVRVESARERRGSGGFGLGLALVKKIVLTHGGSTSASNTHPGLRVDVHLPCDSDE